MLVSVKPRVLAKLNYQNPWKQSLNFFSILSHQNDIVSTNISDIVSTNISITRHCENDNLKVARQLFDEMPNRTVVSWNAMICGYSKWGHTDEALSLFSEMHRTHVGPTETTFSKTLSSLTNSSRPVKDGESMHCLIVKFGAQNWSLVGCSLLHFYAHRSSIIDAERIFEELRGENDKLWSVMLACYAQRDMLREAESVLAAMPKSDVAAWTALIAAHAKSEDGFERALEFFRRMRSDQVSPSEFTLDCVIRVFGRLELLSEGKAVHGLVVKYGFELDQSIGGSLVEFYSVCESICCAKRVFYGLRERDSVCCNLMIKGFAMSGRFSESKKLFEEMTHKTIVSLNTMISVYSSNGEIKNALALFEESKGERDTVTWNAMISGFVRNSLYEEALKLYLEMVRSSINCTRSTFSVLFHVCSCLGSLQLGQSLHARLIKTLLESNVFVGTSLVDMYSKCGSVTDARSSFTFTDSPNVAAWTALINGYAIHGLGFTSIANFARMLKQGIKPNAATFVAILCACRYAGLTNQGMRIFYSMKRYYDIAPSLEHYACVVDLLGRSGRLEEAVGFIEKMPFEADAVIFGALLSACWFWMNLKLGEKVAEKMMILDPKPPYCFVVLSNIYALLGKWNERTELRKRMKSLRAKKGPSCSWIEINSRVHLFHVEDKAHPQSNVVYSTLDHLTTNICSGLH